jgi:hypothetical protein
MRSNARRWQAGHMSSASDEPDESLQVTCTRSMDASTSDLWEAISMPGNLENTHPFCARNPVVVWPGPGARDDVHYLSGWVYRREFTDWVDGLGYDLLIGAEGEQQSMVSWRIAPIAPGGSSLTITIRPRTLRGSVPAWLERPAQFAYVRPLLRRYLASVVQGVDWYLSSGQPVSKNQFGRHPWFSER